jgi:homoserine dehydrogenase
MTNIAILGFGVVGGGVADLITKNYKEVTQLGGDDINIKYILDLRDFPDSPFGDKIVHDVGVIINDSEVDTVIEVMGGSHPAYEFTVAALKSGKNVITSNKEVVANFGDEFLALAEKYGVSYRFETAVGGGIPVISPLISFVRQNKVREVRGILNGTTNYILTKMFTYGDSFESSLKDAQQKGYAERNPDADILGIDACRKIAILSALATDKLPDVNKIPTEGITGIRKEDVFASDKLGCSIKLLGRCIIRENEAPYIMVAPFLISKDYSLSGVSGVYNAVEVVAEPLGNVMFYGPGAGAGPSASAIVGDLVQIMRSGTGVKSPVFVKDGYDASLSFNDYKSRWYVALPPESEILATRTFGEVSFIEATKECAFVTEKLSEQEMKTKLKKLADSGCSILSSIRFL